MACTMHSEQLNPHVEREGEYDATRGTPVDAPLANAGHGLGGAFLDQAFSAAKHVIDTNITGTL